MQFPGVGRWVEGAVFTGDSVAVLQDENVLEVDGGGGRMTT